MVCCGKTKEANGCESRSTGESAVSGLIVKGEFSFHKASKELSLSIWMTPGGPNVFLAGKVTHLLARSKTGDAFIIFDSSNDRFCASWDERRRKLLLVKRVTTVGPDSVSLETARRVLHEPDWEAEVELQLLGGTDAENQ